MDRKVIYNPDSKENLNDRRIFGGNSDGMINFTKKTIVLKICVVQNIDELLSTSFYLCTLSLNK